MDPFCGCGTTIEAAQGLGRRWIGIDITKVSIDVIVDRLQAQHGSIDFQLVGEPSTMEEAAALAELDKHEFEAWAGRRIGAAGTHRKGADRGIDGELTGVFEDGESWRGVVSVKGGKVAVNYVRDLMGVVQRERAEFASYRFALTITEGSIGPCRRLKRLRTRGSQNANLPPPGP